MRIGSKVGPFVETLLQALEPFMGSASIDGPVAQRWKQLRPSAARPLEAWARDFCDLRGSSAHGVNRASNRFVWGKRQHLAYASILFPLLLKAKLAQTADYQVSARDTARMRLLEKFLMFDPNSDEYFDRQRSHPWQEIEQGALSEVLSAQLRDEIRKGIEDGISGAKGRA